MPDLPDQTPIDRANLLGQMIGFFVIAVLTIVFAISFAAIVYSGPMSPALGQGIAHTLAGGAVLALAGIGVYSFRGTICYPQDVTAILLGSAVAGFFAQRSTLDLGTDAAALAPTVGMLVALASLCAGVATFSAGALRLGGIVRYIPHPVIGGFLASTGYLLTIGALGMAAKTNVDITTLPLMFTAELLPKWAPWLLAGLALALVNRRTSNDLFLPLSLTALFAGFYLALPLLGLSLGDAGDLGLLLGPFAGEGFVQALDPAMPLKADWGLILAQIPTLLAIMVLAVLGTLLNSSGVEMALGRDLDVEQDLRATGIANLASGLLGGLPGYPSIGVPLLAQKLGLRGKLPAIAAGIGCVFALLVGAGLLGVLPIGVFAALVAFLGFDLLLEWIWDMRRKLSRADYGLVLAIVAVAAFAGFLLALVAGLLAAVVLFLITYGRINVVRARSTLSERRSRVERPLGAVAYLAQNGGSTVIYELEGYLFFGTANALRKTIKAEIAALMAASDPDQPPAPKSLILDFSRVAGMDVSAMQALCKSAQDVAAAQIPLTFAGLTQTATAQLRDTCFPKALPTLTHSLDAALEQAERTILVARTETDHDSDFAALLRALEPLADPSGPVQKHDCAANVLLIEAGSPSREMYLLIQGTLRAEITGPGGDCLRVAQFQPGAIVGELAHYADLPRTATITTESPAQLLRIDLARLDTTDPVLAGQVHLMTARILARRVVTMTALLRNAGL